MVEQPRMSRIDISHAVEVLLIAAAPERSEELKSLWGKHEERVHLTDSPELDIGAWFGIIQVTKVTLDQVWLLSFAAWRAIQAYSGVIDHLDDCHAPFDKEQVAAINGQAKADADFDDLLVMVRTFRETQESSNRDWPTSVPQPTITNDFTDRQDRAAYELACISGAFIFLHEVKHIAFKSDNNAPASAIEEEIACDLFARNFLMQSADKYAFDSGQDVAKVKAKRALGIMFAKMLMLEISPLEKWSSAGGHPAVGDRVRALLADVPQDVADYFWLATSSLLIAMCRSRSSLPHRISFNGCKDLANQLAGYL